MELGEWLVGREAAQPFTAVDPNLLGARIVLEWMRGEYASAVEIAREAASACLTRQDIDHGIDFLWLLAEFRLQLDQVASAAETAREAAQLSTAHGVEGILAEALVRTGASDAETWVTEERVRQIEHERGRPSLLRARGLFLQRQGDLLGALGALQRSEEAARIQGAAIELGRTMAVLAEVARQSGQTALATEADAERALIVHRIGPEVRGLAWATAFEA
jgi:hypothetical protein